MSKDPTEVLLRFARLLQERNAFDSETLLRLQKFADSANFVDLLIDSARFLNGAERYAFSKALNTVIADPVDWQRVREELRTLAAKRKEEEADRNDARKKTAPIWFFQLEGKPFMDGGARICESARLGHPDSIQFVLRILEQAEKVAVVGAGVSPSLYPLEPDWTAHIALAVHRKRKTFLPISRVVLPSRCRLVCLEDQQTLAEKEGGDDWLDPIGLLWHGDKLLFLVACTQPFRRGISEVHVASVPDSPPKEPNWAQLFLAPGAVHSISCVHFSRRRILALAETKTGIYLCQLFGPVTGITQGSS